MNHWSELVFVTSLLRIVSSQLYGQNYCLLPRLDVVPCTNFFPHLTPDPGANQFSVYQTAFAPGPAGTPICYPVGPPAGMPGVQDIVSIGNEGQVKFLISPGIELSEPYGNQQLVTYNVQCPPNHIAFFNLTFADMEPPTCLDSLGNFRCVDYLTVDRTPFGTSESCGTDTEANSDQLDLGSFIAKFRTSPSVRHSGFRATVICFRQADPPAGCTMPNADGQVMEGESPGRRRKRDLEEFHRMWQWHLTYLKRMKRQSPNILLRFEKINVAHQVHVNFTDKTLVFTDTRTNEIFRRVEDILFLHTFNALGDIEEFREEARDKDRLIPFPGPGPMIIVGRHAYFQLFVIDPRGLLPNANESAVIDRLTTGQFDAITLENETLPTDFLLPPEPVPEEIGLPPLRGKRQAEPAAGVDYGDAIILTAIQFENACNPVLRANAQATLESANPDDVNRLRNGMGSGMGIITP